MPIIATTLATEQRPKDSPHPILEFFIRKILPAANPELESLYPEVRLWWVEVDDAGIPQRELGFDSTRQAIVAGPIGDNMGFWTDSAMVFIPGKYEPVKQETFESAWYNFESQWRTSHAAINGV